MAKIKLIPEPTFKLPVPVPVPGGGLVEVEFTFKYRDRDELQRYAGQCNPESPHFNPDLKDHEMVMGCAVGWELADGFTEENVKTFCSNYIAGPTAVFETYVAECMGVRQKNFARPRR